MKTEQVLRARISNADNAQREYTIIADLTNNGDGFESLTSGEVRRADESGEYLAHFEIRKGGQTTLGIINYNLGMEEQIAIFTAVQGFISEAKQYGI